MNHPSNPRAVIPLKPVVFQIMLSLSDGERHGYAIVKEVQSRMEGGKKILPGNLYRTLRHLLAQGLIEESDRRPDPSLDDERRRYLRLTPFGLEVTRAEANRLERVVIEARAKNMLSA